jgi:hypothetical protein
MKRCQIFAVVYCSSLLVPLLLFLGCEIGSSDSVTRNVDFNVTGIYKNTNTNTNNGKLVSDNSGNDITQLNLRQTGDQLEANDNNGIIFSGSIGDEGDFTMTGRTTAGTDGTMTGTIKTSGDQATMRGTWIEPSFYGTVYGVATVPTNSISESNPTISSSISSLATNGATAILTASGGSGTYKNWAVSDDSLGTVSPTSGGTVTYARKNSGSVTITVTDSNNRQGQKTLAQP